MAPAASRWARKASQAILPRQTTTRTRGSASISAARCTAQLRISWGGGLSPGGAQRTTEAIHAWARRRRSSGGTRGGGVKGRGGVRDLLGRGLVAGRRAADDGSDPRVAQAKAVVGGDGAGPRG